MKSEEPRYALITGASRGIGEAFARLLAAEGWGLVLTARTESDLNRVSGVLTTHHAVPIVAIPLDLARPDAVGFLVRELERRGIEPEVVINNAGFGLLGAAHELSADEQVEMVDLNVRAVADLTLRLLPSMLGRGRGGVLNIASLAGFMPGPFMAVYHASKAFVVSFSEALAAEIEGSGVSISAFCPGPVATGFQARAGMHLNARSLVIKVLKPEAIVEDAWRAFERGERIITTSPLMAVTTWAVRTAPRRLLLGTTKRAFARMKPK